MIITSLNSAIKELFTEVSSLYQRKLFSLVTDARLFVVFISFPLLFPEVIHSKPMVQNIEVSLIRTEIIRSSALLSSERDRTTAKGRFLLFLVQNTKPK